MKKSRVGGAEQVLHFARFPVVQPGEPAATVTPGQVPGLDTSGILDEAKEPTPVQRFFVPREMRTPEDVLRDLPLDDNARAVLTRVLSDAKMSGNEVSLRGGIMGALRDLRLEAGLREVLLDRALSYYRRAGTAQDKAEWLRRQTKAGTMSGNPTFVIKAEPRGGAYHRRVTTPEGHKYFYSEEAYRRSGAAHVDGRAIMAQKAKAALLGDAAGGIKRASLSVYADRFPGVDVESLAREMISSGELEEADDVLSKRLGPAPVKQAEGAAPMPKKPPQVRAQESAARVKVARDAGLVKAKPAATEEVKKSGQFFLGPRGAKHNVGANVGQSELSKAGQFFIGPRGGKWADAAHTIPWKPEAKAPRSDKKRQSEPTARKWVQTVTDYGLPRDTQAAYKKDGKYTEERAAIHEDIKNEFLKGVSKVPPGQTPVAVVMMGGPGSGKGTVLKHLMGDSPDFVNVNADDVKERLPEYERAIDLTGAGEDGEGERVSARDAAASVHEESTDVMNDLLAQAKENRQNLILDGTGKNAETYGKKIQALKDAGYHIRLVMPHITLSEAQQRVSQRADRSGRWVPSEIVETAHHVIPGNFEKLAAMSDEAVLVDNSKPPPRPVYTKSGSGENVLDESFMQEFRRLGTELHGVARQRGWMKSLRAYLSKAEKSDMPLSITMEDFLKRFETNRGTALDTCTGLEDSEDVAKARASSMKKSADPDAEMEKQEAEMDAEPPEPEDDDMEKAMAIPARIPVGSLVRVDDGTSLRKSDRGWEVQTLGEARHVLLKSNGSFQTLLTHDEAREVLTGPLSQWRSTMKKAFPPKGFPPKKKEEDPQQAPGAPQKPAAATPPPAQAKPAPQPVQGQQPPQAAQAPAAGPEGFAPGASTPQPEAPKPGVLKGPPAPPPGAGPAAAPPGPPLPPGTPPGKVPPAPGAAPLGGGAPVSGNEHLAASDAAMGASHAANAFPLGGNDHASAAASHQSAADLHTKAAAALSAAPDKDQPHRSAQIADHKASADFHTKVASAFLGKHAQKGKPPAGAPVAKSRSEMVNPLREWLKKSGIPGGEDNIDDAVGPSVTLPNNRSGTGSTDGIPGAETMGEGSPQDDLVAGDPKMEPGAKTNGGLSADDAASAAAGDIGQNRDLSKGGVSGNGIPGYSAPPDAVGPSVALPNMRPGPGSTDGIPGAEDMGETTRLSADDRKSVGEIEGEPGVEEQEVGMEDEGALSGEMKKGRLLPNGTPGAREDEAFAGAAARVARMTAELSRDVRVTGGGPTPVPMIKSYRDGVVHYSNAADLAVETMLKSEAGEGMGIIPMMKSPVTSSMMCKACKSAMPGFLTSCPNCGGDASSSEGSMEKSFFPEGI